MTQECAAKLMMEILHVAYEANRDLSYQLTYAIPSQGRVFGPCFSGFS
jgi:hypothetical protein